MLKDLFFVDDYYFDEINTQEKAYILGFLVADGCVREEIRKTRTSYRIAFNNSIDDAETINLIHDKICPEAKIVIPKILYNRRKKQQLCLQWTSEHMANTLKSYNINPRKTYDKNFVIPENLLTDELWRHFIRGFFDGDGSSHLSGTSSFCCTISMASEISNKIGIPFRIQEFKSTNKVIDAIASKKSDSRKMYSYMYKNATIYLNRKYKRFENIFGPIL